jgi:C-terminal processing protease CtpA/Prc
MVKRGGGEAYEDEYVDEEDAVEATDTESRHFTTFIHGTPMGLTISASPIALSATVVRSVEPGGHASFAGILPGDIILRVQDESALPHPRE